MGIALWLLCGGAAFAASRAVAAGRTPRYAGELVAALLIAFAAGFAATALDFGGWNELDWRAGLFAILGSLAVIAFIRIVRLARRSVA